MQHGQELPETHWNHGTLDFSLLIGHFTLGNISPMPNSIATHSWRNQLRQSTFVMTCLQGSQQSERTGSNYVNKGVQANNTQFSVGKARDLGREEGIRKRCRGTVLFLGLICERKGIVTKKQRPQYLTHTTVWQRRLSSHDVIDLPKTQSSSDCSCSDLPYKLETGAWLADIPGT